MSFNRIILVLSAISLVSVEGLIGYDCSHRNLNITSFDLLNVENCKQPDVQLTVENRTIQLVQLAKMRTVHVSMCKIEIDRTVTRCSWFSDAQVVLNGRARYLTELNHKDCLQMTNQRFYQIRSSITLDNLIPNGTVTRLITLAGSVDSAGSCSGVSYSDTWGTWEKVVVTAQITIELKDLDMPADLAENLVVFPSGYRCKYSDGFCRDPIYGMSVWDKLTPSPCDREDYDVLYEGPAKLILPSPGTFTGGVETVYSVDTGETIFALTAKKASRLCHQMAIETEHPRLYILEAGNLGFLKKKEALNVYSTDLFTYVNSKFVYLEKHFHRQLSSMYADLIRQKCELEQEVLRQRLTMALISLSEFAYLQGAGPGYTAVSGGEVVYLIKCQPVPVKVRTTERCYHELPVLVNNQTKFLSPRSRIVQSHATEVACSRVLPSQYQLDNQWYSLSPAITQTSQPQKLQPISKSTWSYIKPGELATSGIYDDHILQELSDHIMFPVELPAITNTLARSVSVSNIDRQDLMFHNLLDEGTLNKIINTTWNKMWGWFSTLGNIVSGLFGLYMVLRVLKFFLDTTMHCLMINDTLGSSWKLALGLWDSGTSYVLNKYHLSNKDQDHYRTQPPIVVDDHEKCGEAEKLDPTHTNVHDHPQSPYHHPSLYPSPHFIS